MLPTVGKVHDEQQVYAGEPFDISLLASYAEHVALRLWEGEDQGELKLVSHKCKLSKFRILYPQI